MQEFRNSVFKDIEGSVTAEVGDKVGVLLNSKHLPVNKLRFYTIVFSYGNKGQRYLSDDKAGLCFVDGDRYTMKIYTNYEQAKKVMEELATTSFPNEGILQVYSLELSAVGEPSKGISDFMGHLGGIWYESEDSKSP